MRNPHADDVWGLFIQNNLKELKKVLEAEYTYNITCISDWKLF